MIMNAMHKRAVTIALICLPFQLTGRAVAQQSRSGAAGRFIDARGITVEQAPAVKTSSIRIEKASARAAIQGIRVEKARSLDAYHVGDKHIAVGKADGATLIADPRRIERAK